MAFLELRASTRLLRVSQRRLSADRRETPERILLEADPSLTPSDKPPVRIYLGTQAEQHRAERVFIWSIEQVRDPTRAYEIFLMKSLSGFDQRGWTTGFTNYRFAIPHFAGAQGRAIYNDVDQIYLADPGELFDLPMDKHGFLAITEKESSVMLIDCARMAPVWKLPEVQLRRRGYLLKQALAKTGCWGPLSPEWNARDKDEFDPDRAKCVHFTTLHTQPWRPTPWRFAYLSHPMGELWYRLEDAANRDGYQVFTAAHPSAAYHEGLTRLRRAGSGHPPPGADPKASSEIGALIEATGATALLYYTVGGPGRPGLIPEVAGLSVTRYDPTLDEAIPLADARYDGVLLDIASDSIPIDDLPWLIDEMFSHAEKFVCLRIDQPGPPRGILATRYFQDTEWWQGMCRLAAEHHAATLRWKLILHTSRVFGSRVTVREGGRRQTGEPDIWVLTGDDPFYDGQALALAKALGWPYVEKRLRFGVMGNLPNKLLGATVRTLRSHSRAELEAPWPGLVIASGRRSAPIARWIGQCSRGASRLVLLGDQGAESAEGLDALVSPGYARLWPHPNRIETLVPLPVFTKADLVEAGLRAPDCYAGLTPPRILLFTGGTGEHRALELESAGRLGEQVSGLAAALGGSVVALANDGLTDQASQALDSALGAHGTVRPGADESGNTRLAYLAQADAVAVTDRNVAELGLACTAAKPLYICSLPNSAPGRPHAIRDWIHTHALSRPANQRGTTRPQQGLEYLCARLIAGGYVRPTPRPEMAYAALIEQGYALPCKQSPPARGPNSLDQMARVVERLKSLLESPRVF